MVKPGTHLLETELVRQELVRYVKPCKHKHSHVDITNITQQGNTLKLKYLITYTVYNHKTEKGIMWSINLTRNSIPG